MRACSNQPWRLASKSSILVTIGNAAFSGIRAVDTGATTLHVALQLAVRWSLGGYRITTVLQVVQQPTLSLRERMVWTLWTSRRVYWPRSMRT